MDYTNELLFLFFLVLRKLVLLTPASKYVSEGQRPENKKQYQKTKSNCCLYDSEHGVYKIIQKNMFFLIFLVANPQNHTKNNVCFWSSGF